MSEDIAEINTKYRMKGENDVFSQLKSASWTQFSALFTLAMNSDE